MITLEEVGQGWRALENRTLDMEPPGAISRVGAGDGNDIIRFEIDSAVEIN